MKFTCLRDNLAEAISSVQKAVSSKSTLAVLEGILVTADDKLKLTGYDYELGIECFVDANIEKTGAVVIHSRIFGDIIRRLPEDEVTIELKENHMVSIDSGFSHFDVKGIPAQSFPALPEVQKDLSFRISGMAIRDMIRQTIFAVSTDDYRPVFKGELVECNGREVNMVALDGHRIAHRKYYLDGDHLPFKAIIPGKTLNEVSRLITQDEENIDIFLSGNQILFEFGNCRVISRLLEGDFLDYRAAIPEEFECSVIVKTRSLLASIERASLLARDEKKNPVMINVKVDELVITSSTELGEVKENLQVETKGKELTVGFNPKYLMDALRAIDDEEVVFEISSFISNFRPVEGDIFNYMVLPIRIA